MTYKVGMLGNHWVMNSLAVLAAVEAVKADLGLGGLGLAELKPLVGRGRRDRIYFDVVSNQSILLIDESYNANPASMSAAIKTLGQCDINKKGRRIAVLGDMAELGGQADQLHADLSDILIDAHIDELYACGKHMKKLTEKVKEQNTAMKVQYFADKLALEKELLKNLHDGDVIMVKGSNSSGMGTIVQVLKELDFEQDKQAANG